MRSPTTRFWNRFARAVYRKGASLRPNTGSSPSTPSRSAPRRPPGSQSLARSGVQRLVLEDAVAASKAVGVDWLDRPASARPATSPPSRSWRTPRGAQRHRALCSCYPARSWATPGVVPDPELRWRIVRWPRQVLSEFGLELPDGVEVRVGLQPEASLHGDADAPGGHRGWTEDQLPRSSPATALSVSPYPSRVSPPTSLPWCDAPCVRCRSERPHSRTGGRRGFAVLNEIVERNHTWPVMTAKYGVENPLPWKTSLDGLCDASTGRAPGGRPAADLQGAPRRGRAVGHPIHRTSLPGESACRPGTFAVGRGSSARLIWSRRLAAIRARLEADDQSGDA